jgi:hypothetical protein
MAADCTFRQGHGLTLTLPAGQKYHSIDLKSATDRFPVDLQERLLSALTDLRYASSWREIMVGYEFDFNGSSVFYKAGQPMGAHSSWPLFTLCHHFIVWWAARECNLHSFTDYRILGDDIVIANDAVAERYRKILSMLDVPISETKTHVSNEIYEMAKRWVYKGEEVSPFPLSGLLEVVGKYHLTYELLQQSKTRGYTYPSSSGETQSVATLLTALGYPPRKVWMYVRNYKALSILPNGKQDLEEIGRRGLIFANLFNLPVSCNIGLAGIGKIFTNHAANTFTWNQARIADQLLVKFNEWSIQLTVALNKEQGLGPEDQSELFDHWKEVLPAPSLLESKSQESLDSIQPSFGANYTMEEFWCKTTLARILVLPDSNGINPTRSSHQLVGSRAHLVKSIVQTWKRMLLGLRPGEPRSRKLPDRIR